MKHDIDPLFHGVRVPEPDDSRRESTLAGLLLAQSDEARPGFIDRLWASTALRTAWAAAILILVSGHLFFALTTPTVAGSSSAAGEVGIARTIEEREFESLAAWSTSQRNGAASRLNALDHLTDNLAKGGIL